MVKKNITAAIIQARYNSKRFEGKVLKKINGITLLEILIKRVKRSKKIDKIIVACTKNKKDKKIISICNKLKIKCFAGSEKNVLKRYFDCAKKFKIKNIIRITSDCPLVDPKIIDSLIDKYKKNNLDYASNIIVPTYPDGLDVELIKFDLLKKRYFYPSSSGEKEHVTPEMIKDKNIKKYNLTLNKDFSNLRLTIDTKYDFHILHKLLKYFKYDFHVNTEKILKLYISNNIFFEKNAYSKRNKGSELNIGQKYWIRANEIIPGGTMLFSKNPDLQLPFKWPAYFSKTKGCNVWDLENKKYDDIFLMGVGTNILGYSNNSIDKKVKKVVSEGNMSSLNSIDEILLAEKLIEIHPWSEMVRLTRTGGEANAVAIRIARSYLGKDNVAVCGYHGWHDWYLSANITDKNALNNHLMSGLKTNGIPKKLKKTSFSFEFNNFNQLKEIVETKNIGIIKMEVERDVRPKNNFLKKVRELATKKNIILIFDECTSGFRSNFGGLHLKYNVIPDIAILGKALGNGYAINAIIGKKDIMNACKDTFVSSTFWTERIGPAAALETLKTMNRLKSWKLITQIGQEIKKNWLRLAKENSLNIQVSGLDALPKFVFLDQNNNLFKTLISQEMLKNNILASNVVYTSVSHKRSILQKYYNVLNNTFKMISKCKNEEENIFNYLKSAESIKGLRNKNV